MKHRINRALSLILIIPILTVFSGIFGNAFADEPNPAEPAAAIEAATDIAADPVPDILTESEVIPAAAGTLDNADPEQEIPEIEDADPEAFGTDDILEESPEEGKAEEEEEDSAMVLFADDNVSPYDPGTIVIPFTKNWDDHDDEDEVRPSSININLYRYKGDTYSDSDLFKTASVTAANNWEYSFVLSDSSDPAEALFYLENGEYHVYNFAVEEEDISSYTETEHTDPAIAMGPTQDYWDRHTPNNELTMEIETGTYPKHFIAIKATGQAEYGYYIWTPEILSPMEQRILEAFCEKQAGYGGETWGNTGFLTGFGYHGEVGFTVTVNRITFDRHSSWAMWAAGMYTRSTELENSAAITNKHDPAVDVTVTKVWEDENDQDGFRPDSVTINLLADGKDAGEDPLVLDEDGEWSGSWTGLPRYSDGEAIVYTVEEETDDVITGEDTETTYAIDIDDEQDEDGNYSFTVTNTHTPIPTTVTVTKVWEDEDDKDGFRPDSVTINLLADDEDAGEDPLVLDEDGEWSGSWTGLPRYSDGEAIVYTVEEETDDVITGEDTETTYAITIDDEQDEDGNYSFTVTNKHTPVPVKVDVTKIWEDENDKDGFRPDSVTINLLADGKDAGEDPLVLDEDCEWAGSWEELPRYADGAAIVYTVEEETDDVITGEDTETTYAITIDDEQDEDGNYSFTVTNKHTPVPTTVTVTKVWEDEDDKDGIRPGSVEAKLYAGDTLVEDVEPLTLDENGKWTGTWEGLPKYAGGELIEYTVKETVTNVITGTDGEGTYAYKVAAGETENSFIITNTHTPKEPELITINVTKVWDDADNKDKLRPDAITVRLLADGKEVSSVKITAKDSWKAAFKDLPAEKDGKKIEYTVSEDKVNEYTAAISGSADKGFTIKNSHTPKKDPGKPDDPTPGPKTGDGSNLFLLILVLAESFILFCLAVFGRRYLIRKR